MSTHFARAVQSSSKLDVMVKAGGRSEDELESKADNDFAWIDCCYIRAAKGDHQTAPAPLSSASALSPAAPVFVGRNVLPTEMPYSGVPHASYYPQPLPGAPQNLVCCPPVAPLGYYQVPADFGLGPRVHVSTMCPASPPPVSQPQSAVSKNSNTTREAKFSTNSAPSPHPIS